MKKFYCRLQLLIGAKGEDPPKMLAHFGRAVNFLGSLFNVLREIAVSGDPAGAAEEAPQSPRGKRSLSWKSTAIFTINTKLF
jgi:hypothetical protein